MKSNKIIYILVAIVIVLILFLFIGKKMGWINSEKGTPVAVEKVSKKTIIETVPANGKIYSQTEVKISAEVSGEVIELYVKEGDSVTKGQLLVKINPSIYESEVVRSEAYVNQMKANESNAKANLAQVQAQFDQARSSYERSKELLKNKVISQAEYDQAFTTFKTASANYEAAIQTINAGGFSIKSAQASSIQAKQNLNKTLIYSPISGIVSKLNIEKGERVLGTAQMAGTELMRISDLNNMETRVDINENDVLRISLGDTAEIEVDAYLNRKFKGIVSEIAYASKSDFSITTDQVTNFTVKIKLLKESYIDLIQPEKGHRFPFRPGMSATADIQTNKKDNVLAVPIQSVTIRDPKKSILDVNKSEDGDTKKVLEEIVFVVENNKAKAVKVKTGLQDDTNIEIISGLTGNEQVIFAPFKAISKTLKDGDVIIIKKEDDLYKLED